MLKGTHHTEEAKEKNRKNHLGRDFPNRRGGQKGRSGVYQRTPEMKTGKYIHIKGVNCGIGINKNLFEKGIKPWNTGKNLPLHTKERKNKQRELMKKLWSEGKISGMTGQHHTEEAKNKIGLNGFHYGMLGKKTTEETKRKQSKSHKGDKCHFWKGGITPINNQIRGSLKYKLWQARIFSKDEYRCKKCIEKRKSKLVAHHIKNFSQYHKLRFAINNGFTFCKVCHKKFHCLYGIKNNTKEQIEKFCITKGQLKNNNI